MEKMDFVKFTPDGTASVDLEAINKQLGGGQYKTDMRRDGSLLIIPVRPLSELIAESQEKP